MNSRRSLEYFSKYKDNIESLNKKIVNCSGAQSHSNNNFYHTININRENNDKETIESGKKQFINSMKYYLIDNDIKKAKSHFNDNVSHDIYNNKGNKGDNGDNRNNDSVNTSVNNINQYIINENVKKEFQTNESSITLPSNKFSKYKYTKYDNKNKNSYNNNYCNKENCKDNNKDKNKDTLNHPSFSIEYFNDNFNKDNDNKSNEVIYNINASNAFSFKNHSSNFEIDNNSNNNNDTRFSNIQSLNKLNINNIKEHTSSENQVHDMIVDLKKSNKIKHSTTNTGNKTIKSVIKDALKMDNDDNRSKTSLNYHVNINSMKEMKKPSEVIKTKNKSYQFNLNNLNHLNEPNTNNDSNTNIKKYKHSQSFKSKKSNNMINNLNKSLQKASFNNNKCTLLDKDKQDKQDKRSIYEIADNVIALLKELQNLNYDMKEIKETNEDMTINNNESTSNINDANTIIRNTNNTNITINTNNDLSKRALYLNRKKQLEKNLSLFDSLKTIFPMQDSLLPGIKELVSYAKLSHYSQNQLIHLFNEKAEKNYIMLKGTAAVIQPVAIEIEFTIKQYLMYLLRLKQLSLLDLFDTTVAKNYHLVQVNDSNFDEYLGVMLTNELLNYSKFMFNESMKGSSGGRNINIGNSIVNEIINLNNQIERKNSNDRDDRDNRDYKDNNYACRSNLSVTKSKLNKLIPDNPLISNGSNLLIPRKKYQEYSNSSNTHDNIENDNNDNGNKLITDENYLLKYYNEHDNVFEININEYLRILNSGIIMEQEVEEFYSKNPQYNRYKKRFYKEVKTNRCSSLSNTNTDNNNVNYNDNDNLDKDSSIEVTEHHEVKNNFTNVEKEDHRHKKDKNTINIINLSPNGNGNDREKDIENNDNEDNIRSSVYKNSNNKGIVNIKNIKNSVFNNSLMLDTNYIMDKENNNKHVKANKKIVNSKDISNNSLNSNSNIKIKHQSSLLNGLENIGSLRVFGVKIMSKNNINDTTTKNIYNDKDQLYSMNSHNENNGIRDFSKDKQNSLLMRELLYSVDDDTIGNQDNNDLDIDYLSSLNEKEQAEIMNEYYNKLYSDNNNSNTNSNIKFGNCTDSILKKKSISKNKGKISFLEENNTDNFNNSNNNNNNIPNITCSPYHRTPSNYNTNKDLNNLNNKDFLYERKATNYRSNNTLMRKRTKRLTDKSLNLKSKLTLRERSNKSINKVSIYRNNTGLYNSVSYKNKRISNKDNNKNKDFKFSENEFVSRISPSRRKVNNTIETEKYKYIYNNSIQSNECNNTISEFNLGKATSRKFSTVNYSKYISNNNNGNNNNIDDDDVVNNNTSNIKTSITQNIFDILSNRNTEAKSNNKKLDLKRIFHLKLRRQQKKYMLIQKEKQDKLYKLYEENDLFGNSNNNNHNNNRRSNIVSENDNNTNTHDAQYSEINYTYNTNLSQEQLVNRKQVFRIFMFKNIKEIKEGELIGDFDITAGLKKSDHSIIVTSNDCNLLSIKTSMFRTQLHSMYEKLFKENLNIIHDSALFLKYNRKELTSTIYPSVGIVKTNKGKLLPVMNYLSQLNTTSNLFIIKNGEYAVYIKCNIMKLRQILNSLSYSDEISDLEIFEKIVTIKNSKKFLKKEFRICIEKLSKGQLLNVDERLYYEFIKGIKQELIVNKNQRNTNRSSNSNSNRNCINKTNNRIKHQLELPRNNYFDNIEKKLGKIVQNRSVDAIRKLKNGTILRQFIKYKGVKGSIFSSAFNVKNLTNYISNYNKINNNTLKKNKENKNNTTNTTNTVFTIDDDDHDDFRFARRKNKSASIINNTVNYSSQFNASDSLYKRKSNLSSIYSIRKSKVEEFLIKEKEKISHLQVSKKKNKSKLNKDQVGNGIDSCYDTKTNNYDYYNSDKYRYNDNTIEEINSRFLQQVINHLNEDLQDKLKQIKPFNDILSIEIDCETAEGELFSINREELITKSVKSNPALNGIIINNLTKYCIDKRRKIKEKLESIYFTIKDLHLSNEQETITNDFTNIKNFKQKQKFLYDSKNEETTNIDSKVDMQIQENELIGGVEYINKNRNLKSNFLDKSSVLFNNKKALQENKYVFSKTQNNVILNRIINSDFYEYGTTAIKTNITVDKNKLNELINKRELTQEEVDVVMFNKKQERDGKKIPLNKAKLYDLRNELEDKVITQRLINKTSFPVVNKELMRRFVIFDNVKKKILGQQNTSNKGGLNINNTRSNEKLSLYNNNKNNKHKEAYKGKGNNTITNINTSINSCGNSCKIVFDYISKFEIFSEYCNNSFCYRKLNSNFPISYNNAQKLKKSFSYSFNIRNRSISRLVSKGKEKKIVKFKKTSIIGTNNKDYKGTLAYSSNFINKETYDINDNKDSNENKNRIKLLLDKLSKTKIQISYPTNTSNNLRKNIYHTNQLNNTIKNNKSTITSVFYNNSNNVNDTAFTSSIVHNSLRESNNNKYQDIIDTSNNDNNLRSKNKRTAVNLKTLNQVKNKTKLVLKKNINNNNITSLNDVNNKNYCNLSNSSNDKLSLTNTKTSMTNYYFNKYIKGSYRDGISNSNSNSHYNSGYCNQINCGSINPPKPQSSIFSLNNIPNNDNNNENYNKNKWNNKNSIGCDSFSRKSLHTSSSLNTIKSKNYTFKDSISNSSNDYNINDKYIYKTIENERLNTINSEAKLNIYNNIKEALPNNTINSESSNIINSNANNINKLQGHHYYNRNTIRHLQNLNTKLNSGSSTFANTHNTKNITNNTNSFNTILPSTSIQNYKMFFNSTNRNTSLSNNKNQTNNVFNNYQATGKPITSEFFKHSEIPVLNSNSLSKLTDENRRKHIILNSTTLGYANTNNNYSNKTCNTTNTDKTNYLSHIDINKSKYYDNTGKTCIQKPKIMSVSNSMSNIKQNSINSINTLSNKYGYNYNKTRSVLINDSHDNLQNSNEDNYYVLFEPKFMSNKMQSQISNCNGDINKLKKDYIKFDIENETEEERFLRKMEEFKLKPINIKTKITKS